MHLGGSKVVEEGEERLPQTFIHWINFVIFKTVNILLQAWGVLKTRAPIWSCYKPFYPRVIDRLSLKFWRYEL